MKTARTAVLVGVPLALVALGLVALRLTSSAWADCTAPASDACLTAMDQPPHTTALAGIWLAALFLPLIAVIALPRRAWSAALWASAGVLVLNYGTDYAVTSAIAGGHWDTAPGTGHLTAAGMLLAGALLGVTALLSRRAPRPSTGARDTVLARQDSTRTALP